jgi:hypothetical protein
MGFIPEWAVGVGFIVLVVAVAQVVVVKLRASTRIPPPPPPDKETGELRQAVEAMENRLGDLEERVDFTERLLARQRDAERLEPPQG